MSTGLQVVAGLFVGLVLLVLAYRLLVWPWARHRGATRQEAARALPGDACVPAPRTGYTQAITIHAPPEAIWPWLVQIGYQRAGWYTYDWIYRVLRAADFYDGGRSAERVIPELQNLSAGDTIRIFDQAPFEVVELVPARVLVLLARADLDSGQRFELSDPLPAKYLNQSWAFVLEPLHGGRSRLLARWRGDYSPGLANTLGMGFPTQAGALIMQPRMLKGIKERAERR